MKKIILFTLAVFTFSVSGYAQKYFTKSGKITFDATASSSPEQIEAVNRSATAVIDIKTGAIQFSVLVKGFSFERALMEEHFNENYMESNKFPKSEFKGTIANNTTVDYSKDGTYNVKVQGKLTIHGVTKDINTDGKLVIQGGKINATADFNVLLTDYGISIPGLVADKVGKTAKISVNCSLELFKG
ncbi:MAG: YceI family protein [Chitinophagaceae bacterium]|nr:YceI family protein [Chitinophagaceae bacterium]MBK8951314.1 YceI family protein [Chitinophagaceae bacterium]